MAATVPACKSSVADPVQATLGSEISLRARAEEMIFVCFFTFELVTKVLVHRQYYFCNEDALRA